jgi:hypothetical protein
MALRKSDTQMRLQYLATEGGCQLPTVYTGGANANSTLSATGETYALRRAYDSGFKQVAGASLATIAGLLAGVDPTITSAT